MQFYFLLPLLFLFSCSAENSLESKYTQKLTSLTGVERTLQFTSYVYVPLDADDASIRLAINQQLQTSFSLLNQVKIAVDDIEYAKKMPPSTWQRKILAVLDAENPSFPSKQIQRIGFEYKSRVLASNELAETHTLTLILLLGTYTEHMDELWKNCTDDFSAQTGVFWHDFRPQLPSCQTLLEKEKEDIHRAENKRTPGAAFISSAEANRWFLPIEAQLGPESRSKRTFSPEYNRLFASNKTKDKFIVYAFGGVDFSGSDPNDEMGKEHLKFLRRMYQTHPDMKIDAATPCQACQENGELRFDSLLNVYDRWVYFNFDIQITPVEKNGASLPKTISVQMRTFYGTDTGTEEEQKAAYGRFQEAFWKSDIFIYNGHSHMGGSMVNPSLYPTDNFNDHYQLILINSCNSFTYYRQGFFDKKPGGAQNLDMITNGSSSAILNSGEVEANFLNGLFACKNYEELLKSMHQADEGEFNELRVVDGELDNHFSST
jgi:hypothetical protein